MNCDINNLSLVEGKVRKGNSLAKSTPIGHEKLSDDGYIYVKTATSPARWKRKHLLVWEHHYGKVPKGYCLIFKDDNKANCNIDNLECVPMAEILVLNRTFPKLPIELKVTARLLVKLKLAINQRKAL